MRVLVACVVLATALFGVAPASAQSTPENPATQTHIVVEFEADGDARWTVETRLPINGSNETEGFRDLGERYADGGVQSTYTAGTFERIAEQAGEETGRSMAIANQSRSWRIETGTPSRDARESQNGTDTGVLSLSFTWTNFARVEEDQVVVGDAFDIDDRWLPQLRAGQTLIFRAPENYSITSASVGHTRETVRWEGPTTLEEGDLRVTFTGREGPGAGPDGPALQDLPISLDAVLAIVAAMLLAVVAYVVTRRSSPSEEPGEREPAETEVGPDAAAVGATEDSGESADPFAGVDEDLLSDEERIERHLEVAGGRMKQAEIVDRTGWSNAKVSQVLSQMDEDDRVEKLRIGRENLISLPDEDEP